MSEFSDSYHMLTADSRDVARLIRRSGRYGMILPPSGPSARFIAFIVEGLDEAGGPIDAVVEHNENILVHYSFTDDAGCWLRVFDGADEVADLAFEADLAGRDEPLAALREETRARSLAALLDRGVIDRETAARLRAAAQQPDPRAVGPQVAAALRLEHVAWLSCADLTYQSEQALREAHRGARFINVRQRGKASAGRSFAQLMALPVPEVPLDADLERLAQRHLSYWLEGGDADNAVMPGYPMYELYGTVLPTRYRYLRDQLMNYPDALDSLRRVLRAIVGLVGPDADWEPFLRGYWPLAKILTKHYNVPDNYAIDGWSAPSQP